MKNTLKGTGSRKYSGKQWRLKHAYRPVPFGRRRFKRREISSTLLRAGCTCEEMARLCRTALSNIHYYIRSHRLRAALRDAQIVRFTAEARAHWLAHIERHPGISQNKLASMEPCAYRWLWRYDPAWLAEHRPPTYVRTHRKRCDGTPPRGQGARVAAAVRGAARDIKAQRPCRLCSKNAIRLELGMTVHSFIRAQQNRQVINALAAVVESHDQYRLRVSAQLGSHNTTTRRAA